MIESLLPGRLRSESGKGATALQTTEQNPTLWRTRVSFIDHVHLDQDASCFHYMVEECGFRCA